MTAIYNPKNCTLNWDGLIVTGYADDSMITLEREEENNLPYNGVLGEHSLSKNHTNVYTLTVHLASNSPFLKIFRDYARKDDPRTPLAFSDMNEYGEDFSTDVAYVKQEPELNRGKEIDGVEVEITLVNPDFS